MAISLRVLLLLCLASACGFPRPADVLSDGEIACTANQFVACDGTVLYTCNATGDGTTTQDCGASGCNADAKRCNQCTPNADSCGVGPNELDHCGPDGLPAGSDTCALACTAAPTPHCPYLEPRYLPDVCDAVATMSDFTVSNAANFDTGLDSGCNGGVIRQDGGPEICIVRYASIHITSTGTLIARGARALALVADNALRIEGVLDVSGHLAGFGPGGSTVTSGDAAGSNGGGGAGFATAGGAGGSPTTDGGGGLAGGKATDPSLVTVLVGGTRPTPGPNIGPIVGEGGGAATLIACRGAVLITGTIDAGGTGGGGGKSGLIAGSVFAGAGGGSGGNVVLQGVSIVVTGQVFANGGGGGAGATAQAQQGPAGTDGTRSATEAATGGAATGGGGAGGAGGRQGASPTVGLHPTSAGATPGGGGGSMGFFQTYTPMDVLPTLTPSAASPTFGTNKRIQTR